MTNKALGRPEDSGLSGLHLGKVEKIDSQEFAEKSSLHSYYNTMIRELFEITKKLRCENENNRKLFGEIFGKGQVDNRNKNYETTYR